MDVSSTANIGLQTGLFAFNQAKEVKNEEVLSALGMTPQTEKAQQEIDKSMQEAVASATGKGAGLDIQA